METSLLSGSRRPRTRRSSPFSRFCRVLAVLCATAVVTVPVSAQETPYQVNLHGVESPLRDLLMGTSSLFRLVEEPPPSPIGLRRRADSDRERLQAAMRSSGYYDGSIDIQIDTAVEPARVDIVVTRGPPYSFNEIVVASALGEPLPGSPVTAPEIGIEPGARARAAQVVDAERRLTAMLAERGYAYARVIDRRAVVDHALRTMDVTYTVDPGPLTRFGEVQVEGLEQVRESLVLNRIPWDPEEIYTPERIEDARNALIDLGVFSTVRVTMAESPGPDGIAPVTVNVAERPRRFIGGTVRYDTASGVGGNIYWGHRNLFGGAERLRLSAEVGRVLSGALEETEFGINANFRKPDFLLLNQSLVLDASILREQPEAFQRDAVVLSALLEYALFEGFTARYGVTLERSRVREKGTGEVTNSTLIGLPLGFSYDGTDNLLDPTEGFRTDFSVTPYQQIGGEGSNFTITRLTNSAYYDIADDGRWVLAGRLSVGSIFGADTQNIPADKRFYSGGGGSVRGYGFQRIGPLDINNKPVGGNSLFEVGAELRLKVTETIGIVPFIDGGNVYEDVVPDLSQGLRWGVGLGFRYYTGFGPLRVDVGVPLNKRRDDAAFQLYISLGQAF